MPRAQTQVRPDLGWRLCGSKLLRDPEGEGLLQSQGSLTEPELSAPLCAEPLGCWQGRCEGGQDAGCAGLARGSCWPRVRWLVLIHLKERASEGRLWAPRRRELDLEASEEAAVITHSSGTLSANLPGNRTPTFPSAPQLPAPHSPEGGGSGGVRAGSGLGGPGSGRQHTAQPSGRTSSPSALG